MNRPAPDLKISLPDGTAFEVEKHRGEVVVVEVMLTTCPHCKDCSKALEKIYKTLGPKGFRPVAVAINDNAANLVAGYVKEQGLSFPVGYADRNQVINFVQVPRDKPAYTPFLIFVDRKGIIRAQYTGTDDFFRNQEVNIRKLLDELIAESAD
jgi:peroxiredoxin